MPNENVSDPLPNPVVYLNYLQPTEANEYEGARDVFLVTFGALAWDILSSLKDDWKLIRTTKISPVLLAYFSSRTCALAAVLMSVLAKTGPVQNCSVLELILYIFWVLASASSSYLFLKRVHAVLFQHKPVCHAFTVLWIAGLGASTLVLTVPLHNYYQIANTKHCMNVFDVLVFVAITYKILASHRTTKPKGWKAYLCPKTKALPRLSRAILKGGQQYYMITIGANIARSKVALSPDFSAVRQLAPLIPAVALTSVMACRVFRNLKLETMQGVEAGIVTTMQFADRELVNIHPAKDADLGSTEAGLPFGG